MSHTIEKNKSFYKAYHNVCQTIRKSQQEEAKKYCTDLLTNHFNCVGEDNALEFDSKCEINIVINTSQYRRSEDTHSAYITKLWVQDGYIYADLDIYYEDDSEFNVILENDKETDWLLVLNGLTYLLD